jgi:hypothetical protein
MTPMQFAEHYLSLQVFTFEQELVPLPKTPPTYTPPVGWNQVCVNNYRLGSSSWSAKFWVDNIAPHFNKPVSVRVKTILGDIEDHTFDTAKQARQHFHPPFVGKGSPEQAQIAIQLVYRFRPVSTSLEQFVAGDFIGLDCNGFVGQYIQRVLKKLDWREADVNHDPGPTTLIGDLLRTCGNPVNALDQVDRESTYLFALCNDAGEILDPSKAHPTRFGHIMITEPSTFGLTRLAPRITVVEATAAGDGKLRVLDYFFEEEQAKNGVFRVRRGLNGPVIAVRIARLHA